MHSRASNPLRAAAFWIACCALGAPLAHASSTLTVTGALSPQGTSNYCIYSAMAEDNLGNWQVTCGGAGSKTFTFTTPLTSQVCTSFSSLNEDSGGNWTVANCVSSAPAGTAATVYYVHTDNLGTPRVITRPTDDATMWKWDNTEPFGFDGANESVSGTAFSYNFRFPGQYYDGETGTHYNYFRDLDPSLGRYLESDPIGLRGGLNTYVYAQGRPLGLIDPNGEASFPLPTPTPGQIACAMGPNPAGCDPPPPAPSCFWNCMEHKTGLAALRSLGLKGLARFGPEGLASLAEGAAAIASLARPILIPGAGVYWELKCIDECDACRDSGKGYFSYP